MSGVVIAVYASFFMALAQAALKKSYKEFEPSVAFFINALLGVVLWIPLSFYFGVNFASLGQVLIYAIISAVLSEALYFFALSKGQLSITAILIGSYPIYTIIFSYLLNGEILSSGQLLFIGLTIVGTLITYLPSKLNFKELKQSGAIMLPIIAAIGIGLSDTLSKGIIDKTGDFTFLFALALVQVPAALIFLRIEKQNGLTSLKAIYSEGSMYKNAILGAIFNIIGTGLLWISFSKIFASIASPITATSGAIVILLAIIFMDEKIRLRTMIGLLLVLSGIIGVSTLTP